MSRRTGDARHRLHRWRTAIVSALLVPSCGGAPPPTHHYTLAVRSPGMPAASQGTTLAVASLAVAAAYDTDRIVYRLSPYRIDYYNYHRWGASPGLLVADHLRTAYARTGLFRGVVAELDPDADVVLAGRILAMDEIDETPERWQAHLALELSLRDSRTGSSLWSALYERREPMSERTPEGLARALSAVLAAIVAESAPAIAEHARAAPRAPAAAGSEPIGEGERWP
jgi:ABC-type uncharacterized transport system auxiliary subunit